MACNENVIKNVANEVTRNCQAIGVSVDTNFVIFLIDLLLHNPKYRKLFSKTINRANLEYFVKECVTMLARGDICMNTMKMQFVIQTNYDKLQNLIEKHLDSIDNCLRPLVVEILEANPDREDEAELKKLFRKISIYIVLCSGLGNPGMITTLKEGMAALESVFSLDELKVFVVMPTAEKLSQLNELLEVVSGVRLFNRDCKKGGDGIPDLPFNLVDASKACLASLSNALITVMQRVNSLTSAIADTIDVHEETGNVVVMLPPNAGLTLSDYNQIFDLLTFNRQYEIFIRKLLGDVQTMEKHATIYVDRFKMVLEELHNAVKFNSAVPVVVVFPLFTKLWLAWRAMQNMMYLVSTVNRLMSILAGLQEQMRIPYNVLDKMLKGKMVINDQERLSSGMSIDDRLSLGSLRNYEAYNQGLADTKGRNIQFLGFCAMCLSVGALVPSNVRLGQIKYRGDLYGFCSIRMVTKFSKDPQRYVNAFLDYARNNPHLINLLNIVEQVYAVKDIETLVTVHIPKTKVLDKDVQTEIHPIESYIEKNYTWDLWKWKRRACQWATIVNCRTHSTQTVHSHMRSEIHCQTFEPRDKSLQTKRDFGSNTATLNYFIWGLRGQLGYGQHVLNMTEGSWSEKLKPKTITTCSWPCINKESEKKIDLDIVAEESIEEI